MAQNTVMKVFVQRDYSRGTNCRFMTEMPVELHGKIDQQLFLHTVQGINEILDDAERIGVGSYFENCLGCLTGYLSLLCLETQYDKALRRLNEYVNEQNTREYVPRGLMVTNPMERGLRVKSLQSATQSDAPCKERNIGRTINERTNQEPR